MKTIRYLGRIDGSHQTKNVYTLKEDDSKTGKLDPRFDLRKHSPTGFNWGYGGSGPAQLALAILCDHTGDDEWSQKHYQAFKFGVIGHFPIDGTFTLEASDVAEWVKARKDMEAKQGA